MIAGLIPGVIAGLAAASASSFAQTAAQTTAQTAARTAAPASEQQPAGQDVGLSELDILSSGVDDPFADVVAQERRAPVSVTVRALDKVTAKYTDLTAPMGRSVRFGALEILARYCDKRPPEEFPEVSAFLQVFDVSQTAPAGPPAGGAQEAPEAPRDGRDARSGEGGRNLAPDASSIREDDPAAQIDGIRIFSGWMFASSPALNPLEHPVYDVWVIDCQTEIVSESDPDAE